MLLTASLSLDLDNQWSYMKVHGDSGWEAYPSYLDRLTARVLPFFAARNQRLTFFVVGQDAALDANREALAAIAAAGHEIASHSFRHEPWLHLFSEPEIEDEIARTEERLLAVTGRLPRGFRGPGFSVSAATLRVLQRRGYLYDASSLPTFIGPLARAYYFMTARLSPEERRKRAALFGGMRDGLLPIAPYLWDVGGGSLLEIPVTTMPAARVPIHLSYVLYLSTYSAALARQYFRLALAACRLRRVGPSLLLHPLDFLGGDDVPELAFFPGMRLASAAKLERVTQYLDLMSEVFAVKTMGEHATQLLAQPTLAHRPVEKDHARGHANSRRRAA